jgi:hypothetical protein
MNSGVFPSIWRFFGLVAVQVLLLKQIGLSIDSAYFNVLLYPLFILFLPLQLSPNFMVLLGFAVGMAVDIFYASPGVHASAGAFSGFARSYIVGAFAPKGGYTSKEPVFTPAYVTWQTFIQGSAVFFFFHLFWFFSVDAFTFVFFNSIILKTMVSWGLTMVFVLLYAAMFNPKN